jgi:hypothetical protein
MRLDIRQHTTPLLLESAMRNLILCCLAIAVLSACGSDSAGPNAPMLRYDFLSDLEGWTEGTATEDGWGTVNRYSNRGGRSGVVAMDGTGGPGLPNAWMHRTIPLAPGVTTVRFETSAHNRDGADSDLRVRLVDASQGSHTLLDWESISGAEGEYLWTIRTASIAQFGGTTVTLYFEHRDNGPGSHEQRYISFLEIF